MKSEVIHKKLLIEYFAKRVREEKRSEEERTEDA